METILKDIRFQFRAFIKKPGFAAVAIITLALGIGANTAIFSVISGVLLRPLPFKDPDRLVMIWETSPASRTIHVSHLNFIDWRDQSQSYEMMSAHTGRWGGPSTITGGLEPVRANAIAVYRDFFNVLGIAPAIGRNFLAEEHRFGATPSVIVSYGFWQRTLGGDADLTDKRLTIDGTIFNVVGIMPSGFSFPPDTDLWVPREALGEDTSSRSSHNFRVIARLKPGITLDQAQAEIDTIEARLNEQYPEFNQDTGAAVVSLTDQMVGSVRPALVVLMVAVGFVLLIACANVANLMLARAVSREREMAIRAALGASRLRIVRQLLTESVLLALVGGALGLALASSLIGVLVSLSPGSIYRIDEVGIDSRALVFTFGLSLATSIISGLVPALKASKPDLQDALKTGSKGSSSGLSSARLRSLLVVAEVSLTMVLLVGAGLLIKSFWRLLQVDPGFNPSNVLTMQMSLPSADYPKKENTSSFYHQLIPRLESIKGVDSAGIINNLPLGGVNINGPFQIEGREDGGYGGFRIVSPNYFRAMQISLIKGRYFIEQDTENSEPVVIIDQKVAAKSWPNEDPVGKRIKSSMDGLYDNWITIIGVVGEVHHSGLDAQTYAAIYVPYSQRPVRARDVTVAIRTDGDPTDVVAAVRAQVQSVDKNLPVSFDTMEEFFSRSIASRRYNMLLIGIFAALAVLLSVVGIYGVMSYSVTQSTREIGIRMALGAQQINVLRLVLGQGMALTAMGVTVGAIAAFGLTRLMASLLFGVSATDTVIFATVAVLLAVISLIACYLPARRATRVDPMVALRYE